MPRLQLPDNQKQLEIELFDNEQWAFGIGHFAWQIKTGLQYDLFQN